MALLLAPGVAAARFSIGLQDEALQQTAGANARDAYRVFQKMVGSTVRINVQWSTVAPAGATKPKAFDAANPADPKYNWSAIDTAVRAASAHGAHALLVLYSAPTWAERGTRPSDGNIYRGAWNPDPGEFSSFARAAARRYSGSFADPASGGAKLPRVTDWEVWDEENLPYYLAAPDLTSEYRALLNAGYSAIKGVNAGNVVAMGGLAPVSFLPPRSVSPLKFAAAVMCLRRVGTAFKRVAGCRQHAEFNVFAVHPYSLAATPTKHAYLYDDVLVGDLQKVVSLMRAAQRLHTIAPAGHHPVWTTEFAWWTNPPDKTVGDSQATAARYVAYSMYEMWHAGIGLVIWQTLRDFPTESPEGGGLETSAGRPKLDLRAFEFPVVASVSRGRGFVWGRAPIRRATQVTVERLAGGRWTRVGTARTRADGVFMTRFAAGANGTYRAVVQHGPTSLAYDSRPIPGRRTHLFKSG